MSDPGGKPITAVVFSSDLIFLGLIVNTLKNLGVIPTCTNNPAGYLKTLLQTRPDFTVCDIDGIGAGHNNEIQTVFQEYKDNAILITSAGLNESWQSFLAQVPCLQKPLLMAKFLILVNSIVQSKHSLPVSVSDKISSHGADLGLVAVSQQMINTCQEIENAGRTRLPVMIHGEPGTEAKGKGVVIRHRT
jgi:DNA-binding NtrC family response regulator